MSMQGFRAASEKVWAKVLMGLLIFSFVGWGVADWFLGGNTPNSSLVKVGDVSISVQEFENERNRELAQMEKAIAKQIYADKNTLNYFSRQVLANLTSRILLEQHAEDLGLSVSPAGVANIIKQSPEFWENGAFSTEKFDAVLDMNALSEKDFTETLRKQALREMLIGSISLNLPVPDFMTKALYNARNASRKIEYSTVSFADFAVKGTPTDDNLKEVFAKNPKVVPEYRTISYIMIGATMDNTDSYNRGYDSARSIEDMLVAGDAMRDVAKKMRATYRTFAPMTIQKNTENGTIQDSVFTDDVMHTLFGLESGMESEITESKKGFIIFRVEKVDIAHAVPLESRKSELVNLWRKSEQEKQAYLKANDILSSNKKLNAAVTITRASGAPIEVLNAAFRAPISKATIVSGNNEFYVVRALEEIAPAANPAKQKEIAGEIKSLLPRQIMDDYSGFLGRKYNVSVNERTMRRMFE